MLPCDTKRYPLVVGDILVTTMTYTTGTAASGPVQVRIHDAA